MKENFYFGLVYVLQMKNREYFFLTKSYIN